MQVKVAGYKAEGSDQIVPFTHAPLSRGWTLVKDWAVVDVSSLPKADADQVTADAIEAEADAIRDGLVNTLDAAMPMFPSEQKPASTEAQTLMEKFDALIEQFRQIARSTVRS